MDQSEERYFIIIVELLRAVEDGLGEELLRFLTESVEIPPVVRHCVVLQEHVLQVLSEDTDDFLNHFFNDQSFAFRDFKNGLDFLFFKFYLLRFLSPEPRRQYRILSLRFLTW